MMDDLISRQAAIEAINDHIAAYTSDRPEYNMARRHMAELIAVLPSVQTERKKGKWEERGKDMYINLENAREQYKVLGYPHRYGVKLQCSACNMITIVDESIAYKFCPHCGADMRGEEDVKVR